MMHSWVRGVGKAGEEGKENKLMGEKERKIGGCRRKEENGMRWN